MGIHRGLNTVKDGLVFGYDTGYGVADNDTTTRFYPGRPTTNHGPASFGSWGTEGSAERIATGNYYNGQPTYNCRTVVGQSWRGIETTISGLRTSAGSSGTVTVSCMVRNNNSSAYNMYAYIGHDFGSTRTIAAGSDWQRIQWTVNQSSMGNDYVEFRPYTNNASIYLEMTMPQVEDNVGTATPWTETSRSSTASLVDLKRTTSIDVSNVSFDSTGQPTWDGTSDRITFDPGTFPSAWSQPFSVEAVVYIPSGATWYNQGSGTGIIGRGSYTGSWGLFRGGTDNSVYFYMRTGANTFNPGGIIGRDRYYHIVGTWDGISQAVFYIDGNQNSQETNTNVGSTVDNTGSIPVGGGVAFGGSNGGYGEGTYPVVKLYNKKLTATEIKQNFNAYKNRFDI